MPHRKSITETKLSRTNTAVFQRPTMPNMMSVMCGTERSRPADGRNIQPRWGWDGGCAVTQDGASLVLGFGMQPLRGKRKESFGGTPEHNAQGTPQVYLPSTIARSHRLPGRTRQGAVASLSLRRSYGRIEHRHGPHRQERKTGQMKRALAGEENQEYWRTGSSGIQVAIKAGERS